jgi:hypothetical protein
MLDGDEMDFSNEVPVVRCMWAHVTCPIMSGIQCHCLLRTRLRWLFPVLKAPRRNFWGGQVRSESGHEEDQDWVDRW